MQAENETLPTTLAQWSADFRDEDLPQAVLHEARRVLLDCLGVTLRGSTAPLASAVRPSA